ncbi:hypothetical protein FA13DRAFT_1711266 [Coprinellus micaceus]|uniref:Uncharacterized protein n=1 Tax=Coprinellus micaceus TaxID=71717 RepID=A0A4Y7T6X2_COPMI|nr:hypothetical protein FA13DRAFT_1711266 [Coprinellus micaceus]
MGGGHHSRIMGHPHHLGSNSDVSRAGLRGWPPIHERRKFQVDGNYSPNKLKSRHRLLGNEPASQSQAARFARAVISGGRRLIYEEARKARYLFCTLAFRETVDTPSHVGWTIDGSLKRSLTMIAPRLLAWAGAP